LIGNSKHSWDVVGGLLEGRAGPAPYSILMTERTDFANFHLRVETMMPEGLQNTIRFRITETDGQPARFYTAYIPGTVRPANEWIANTGKLQFFTGSSFIDLADPEPVVATKPGE
jgi:hypothetical protein